MLSNEKINKLVGFRNDTDKKKNIPFREMCEFYLANASFESGKDEIKVEAINNPLYYDNVSQMLRNAYVWSYGSQTIVTSPWSIQFRLDSYDSNEEYINKNTWFVLIQFLLDASLHAIAAYIIVKSKNLPKLEDKLKNYLEVSVMEMKMRVDIESVKLEEFDKNDVDEADDIATLMQKDKANYNAPMKERMSKESHDILHKLCVLYQEIRNRFKKVLESDAVKEFYSSKTNVEALNTLLQELCDYLRSREKYARYYDKAIRNRIHTIIKEQLSDINKMIKGQIKSTNMLSKGAKEYGKKIYVIYPGKTEDEVRIYLKNSFECNKFDDQVLELITDFDVVEWNKPIKAVRYDSPNKDKGDLVYKFTIDGKEFVINEPYKRFYYSSVMSVCSMYKLLTNNSEKVYNDKGPMFLGVNKRELVDTVILETDFKVENYNTHKKQLCFKKLVKIF
jgi:hypothetical protein